MTVETWRSLGRPFINAMHLLDVKRGSASISISHREKEFPQMIRKITISTIASLLSVGLIASASSAHDPANHGAAVSAVAKSEATTGEAHGDAVSAIARSSAGKSSNESVSAIAKTQGDTISDLAHSTTATGAARGDAISDAARMHGTKVSAAARAK